MFCKEKTIDLLIIYLLAWIFFFLLGILWHDTDTLWKMEKSKKHLIFFRVGTMHHILQQGLRNMYL